MGAELARKLQQLERFLERDRRLGHAADERRTFRLLLDAFLGSFAELHVGAEAAVNGVDIQTGGRIDAEKRGPSAFARMRAIAFSTLRSAGASVRRQRCGFPGATFTQLQERAEASDANANRLARLRVGADVDERIVGFVFRLAAPHPRGRADCVSPR